MNNRFPGLIQPVPELIPDELKAINQWIVWETQYDEKRDKWSKIPKQSKFPRIMASKNNFEHFSDFKTACEAYTKFDFLGGIGFILTQDLPFTFFDLDKCIVDGFIEHDAQEVIDDLGSYAEYSPSGKGVRLICLGKLPGKQINNIKLKRELYDGQKNSFLTITGKTIINNKIINNQEVINKYYSIWKTNGSDYETSAVEFNNKFIDAIDLSRADETTIKLIKGDGWGAFPSQSEILFCICINLLMSDFTIDEILSITTNDNYPISQVAEKRRHNNREEQRRWIAGNVLPKAIKEAEAKKATEKIDISEFINKLEEEKKQYHKYVDDLHTYEIPKLTGVLGEIQQYYNDTAKIPQPMFACQTAFGIVSLILGRRFKTVFNDFSSLYFLNIAPTACGKEHIKFVTETILKACNMDHLLAGDGYTSAGAVISTLKEKPVHMTIIDELGIYLEATVNKNNHIGKSANTALMECIGRLNGEVRSKNYSTHGTSSTKTAESILHPAITLQSMTTPSTFYDNLSLKMIKDGFFGRFITHHSKMPRIAPLRVRSKPVPQSIIQWVKDINDRVNDRLGLFHGNSTTIGDIIEIDVSHNAEDLHKSFSSLMVDYMNDFEKYGIEGIIGRVGEFAGRLSLIVALSENPFIESIEKSHSVVSIQYMHDRAIETVQDAQRNLIDSEHQKDKNEVLEAIRLSKDGVSHRDMCRKSPFYKFKNTELNDILKSLSIAELIAYVNVREGKPGKAKMAWIALDEK